MERNKFVKKKKKKVQCLLLQLEKKKICLRSELAYSTCVYLRIPSEGIIDMNILILIY